MNRESQPTPPPLPEAPCCGTCCNAVKSTRSVGRVICTALPPQVVPRGHQGVMAVNMYPEMEADKLGCNVLWNVNFSLFHLIGQALTLAANAEGKVHGDEGSEKPHPGT